MKNLLYAVAIIVFCALSASAQTQLCNQIDDDITFIYDGVATPVPANSIVFWPEAPSGQFTAYIYRHISSGVVEKLGLFKLENENDLIIFDRFRRPLSAFLTNSKKQEALIEYHNLAIFIPPGETVALPDIFITPSSEATVLISECNGDLINPAQPLLLSFKTSPDGLRAEIK